MKQEKNEEKRGNRVYWTQRLEKEMMHKYKKYYEKRLCLEGGDRQNQQMENERE